MSRYSVVRLVGLLLCALGGASCGGDSGVAIKLTPGNAMMAPGATQLFAAMVTGTSNHAVTWSVPQGSAAGTIKDGLYTAPDATGTFTVIAIPAADPSKFASATITVQGGSIVTVTVMPASATVNEEGEQSFAAIVTGASDKRVRWSVMEPAGGSISQVGLYTAPTADGTYHIVATWVDDPTIMNVAQVTVTHQQQVQVAVSPIDTEVAPSGTTTLMATVTGLPSGATSAVTWSVVEGPSGGMVSSAGVYTAPITPGTYHVVAESVADTSKTAIATIVVGTTVPELIIDPGTATLNPGQEQLFSVTTLGGGSPDVNWTADAGTIATDGTYTAPAAPGLYHVTATSKTDSTETATVTVMVTSTPQLSVSLTPSMSTIGVGQAQDFVAIVMNSTGTDAVTFSVDGGGTITQGGIFTATMAGTWHVRAASQQDGSKSSTVTITVVDTPQLSVQLEPTAVTLGINEAQQFTAIVTDATDSSVTLTVLETGGGMFVSSGDYQAPNVPGTYHVVATSVMDPTKQAFATVTVVEAAQPEVTLAETTLTLGGGQMAALQATVTGLTDTSIDWSVYEGALGGTVTADGTYTAPTAPGLYHVIAKAHADPAGHFAMVTITVTALPQLQVTVSPTTANLAATGTQEFAAVVIGSNGDQKVNWSVQETGVGSITTDGVYTAPALGPTTPATVHIVAASDQDPTKRAVATVTLVATPQVQVSVSPLDASLTALQFLNLSATVTGATNTAVRWSVLESSAGGTVDQNGIYQAPKVAGVYHVVATSVQDSTKQGFADITVDFDATRVGVAISPTATSINPNQSQQFYATVTGTTNQTVSWSASGGIIAPDGTYTAPSSAGTYAITAKSMVDPTKSATTFITVTTTPQVVLSVAPLAVTLNPNQVQDFVGTIVNSTDQVINWRVIEPNGGVFMGDGIYTAPGTPGTYHVMASSDADPTKEIEIPVTVNLVPQITVTVTPGTQSLGVGEDQTFYATVTGATNTNVIWKVEEAGGGTIAQDGTYIAPPQAGTYHVVATSAVDMTKIAVAEVTVTANAQLAITLTPTTDTLTPGTPVSFSATITGGATDLSWGTDEPSGALIQTTGANTAQFTFTQTGTFHVRAVSKSDPTKFGLATVVVSLPSVSGTITYSGTATGRIFVVVATAGETGPQLVGGTSIDAPGPFTIRGVTASGAAVVIAWRDATGLREYNFGIDPVGQSSINLAGNSITGANVALTDPPANPLAGSQAPRLDALPLDGYAFLSWQRVTDNSNRELPDHYTVYCDTTATPGPGHAVYTQTFTPETNFVFAPLTNGVKYTCAVTATAHNGTYTTGLGTTTQVMPTPPAGGPNTSTVTGQLNATGVAQAPSATAFVVMYSPVLGQLAQTAVKITPLSGAVPFTMPAVTPGDYILIAFADLNGNGQIDDGDAEVSKQMFAVSGATMDLGVLQLPTAKSVAAAFSGVERNSGVIKQSVGLNLASNTRLPVRVTVVSGPGGPTTIDLPLAVDPESFPPLTFSTVMAGSPQVGDMYSFSITYSDGTTDTQTAKINAVFPQVPSAGAPSTNMTDLFPTFTWSAPPNPPSSDYSYEVRVLGSQGSGTLWQEDLSTAELQAVYGQGGMQRAGMLQLATSYNWQIMARDSFGDFAIDNSSFGTESIAIVPQGPLSVPNGVQQVAFLAETSSGGNVLWSVDGGATISTDGVLTIPNGATVLHVTAMSTTTNQSVVATVNILNTPPQNSNLWLQPAAQNLTYVDKQVFTPEWFGPTAQVNFQVWEAGGGNVDQSGTYFPPNATGTFHVIATDQNDQSVVGVAVVHVAAPLVILPNRPTTLNPGQQIVLTTSSTNPVTWSVLGACGTIQPSGLFTAVSTTGSCVVKATENGGAGRTAMDSINITSNVIPSLSVDPPSATVGLGDTLGLTVIGQNMPATVSGWTVLEGNLGGTVVVAPTTATYNAPFQINLVPPYHVVATSTVDPTKMVIVTINQSTAVPVTVGISPSNVAVGVGQQQTFAVTVNPAGAYTLSAPDGGMVVTSTGVFTAPPGVGTYRVVATSSADPSKKATATVTVTASSAYSVTLSPKSPAGLPIPTGQTLKFSAVATSAASSTYTYAVGGVNCGSILPDGTYTAPPVVGTGCIVKVQASAGPLAASDQTPINVLAPTAPAFTMGGTVSYAGTKSGRVYIVGRTSNYGDFAGTSIPGVGAFTLRASPNGPRLDNVTAYMDVLGTGVYDSAVDPVGMIGSVVLPASNVSITLADPMPPGPGIAYGSIWTTDHTLVVHYTPLRAPNPTGLFGELVDHYTVYVSATPNPGPNNNLMKRTAVAGSGPFIVLSPLPDNQTLYVSMTTSVNGTEGVPNSIGATSLSNSITAGMIAVTGSVNLPPGYAATGPIYIGLVNNNDGTAQVRKVPQGAPPNFSFALSSPAPVTLLAFVDNLSDGQISAHDPFSQSRFYVAGNMAVPITMGGGVSALPQGHLFTYNTTSGPSTSAVATDRIIASGKMPVTCTYLTATHGQTTGPADAGIDNGGSSSSYLYGFQYQMAVGQTTLALGDNVTYLIGYDDGTSDVINAQFNYLLPLPGNLAPVAGSLVALPFSVTWVDPPNLAGWTSITAGVTDAPINIYWTSPNEAVGTDMAPYTGGALHPGDSVYITVSYSDPDGNSAEVENLDAAK
jgi:hypothetical protein